MSTVREEDLDVLLPLVRGYCAFYEETAGIPQPSDDALTDLFRALLADPDRDGLQLLARETATGTAVGFATLYWSWSTLSAARIAVMNDLFVAEDARGAGLAEQLIEACRAVAAQHGAHALQWTTAPDNLRAQAVYDRVGGTRATWVHYGLRA